LTGSNICHTRDSGHAVYESYKQGIKLPSFVAGFLPVDFVLDAILAACPFSSSDVKQGFI
jgi:hypothetical protein